MSSFWLNVTSSSMSVLDCWQGPSHTSLKSTSVFNIPGGEGGRDAATSRGGDAVGQERDGDVRLDVNSDSFGPGGGGWDAGDGDRVLDVSLQRWKSVVRVLHQLLCAAAAAAEDGATAAAELELELARRRGALHAPFRDGLNAAELL